MRGWIEGRIKIWKDEEPLAVNDWWSTVVQINEIVHDRIRPMIDESCGDLMCEISAIIDLLKVACTPPKVSPSKVTKAMSTLQEDLISVPFLVYLTNSSGGSAILAKASNQQLRNAKDVVGDGFFAIGTQFLDVLRRWGHFYFRWQWCANTWQGACDFESLCFTPIASDNSAPRKFWCSAGSGFNVVSDSSRAAGRCDTMLGREARLEGDGDWLRLVLNSCTCMIQVGWFDQACRISFIIRCISCFP